jgi:membrane-bound serine protease (ClpP class)
MRLFLLISFLALFQITYTTAQKRKVYYFKIDQEINPSAARLVNNALEEAKKTKSELIIIHINTFGGSLDAADSIRTKILRAEAPVIAWIDNNAASAGALIALACDSIYMTNGASIGAASVVNANGELMPEKYQSYMRTMMRTTAESNYRNPEIAAAMVGSIKTIPNVCDSGKVLSFTTSEAIKNKYCNKEANKLNEVLAICNGESKTMITQQKTTLDVIINFLLNPAITSLLILIMIGGIYFEFQSPGTIFPIAAGLTAALLYFAPLYLEGLAANWEVMLFIIGLILLALEIFIIPGFGVAGIAGIICIVLGLSLSMLNNNLFDFSFTSSKDMLAAFARVLFSISVLFIIFFFWGHKFFESTMFSHLLLNQDSLKNISVNNTIENDITNNEGVAYTDLRPSGKIFVNGKIYDAQSSGDYILKDTNIKVIAKQGNYWQITTV